MKKALTIFFILAILVCSAIPAFATEVAVPVSTDEITHDITVISAIDETGGTQLISDSTIKIYSVSGIKKELFQTVKTDSVGSAKVSLPEGDYIITEQDFTFDGVKYEASEVNITVDNATNDLILYMKHSVVKDDDIPVVNLIDSDDTDSSDGTSVPFTGSQIAIGTVCALCIAVAVAVVCIATKKKKKNEDSVESNN